VSARPSRLVLADGVSADRWEVDLTNVLARPS
jgi:hypothetical protein